MMEQRERLIELITAADDEYVYSDDDKDGTGEIAYIADHLIANGVVVFPCRCGECVFCEDGNVLWCKHLKIGVSKDAYCSGGKRKGGDE